MFVSTALHATQTFIVTGDLYLEITFSKVHMIQDMRHGVNNIWTYNTLLFLPDLLNYSQRFFWLQKKTNMSSIEKHESMWAHTEINKQKMMESKRSNDWLR